MMPLKSLVAVRDSRSLGRSIKKEYPSGNGHIVYRPEEKSGGVIDVSQVGGC